MSYVQGALEDVEVAHCMDHDEQDQQDGAARQAQSIVGDPAPIDAARAPERRQAPWRWIGRKTGASPGYNVSQ